MGLFDAVVGAAMGQLQQQPGAGGGLGEVLGGLLGNDGAHGGLSGLQTRFQEAGLGHLIQSWIGSGDNLPISAEQLHAVLGSDAVRQIAGRLGVDPDQAAQQLSTLLPGLVDRLTPGGQAPSEGLGNGADLFGMLGGLLNR